MTSHILGLHWFVEAAHREPSEESMATEIIRYFEYAHLPEKLQAISRPIGDLALMLDDTLPASAEKSAGLRKLLEAKDCFVRAALS